MLEGLKSYIGEGEPNAEYAQLGFAITNYTRNALLVEKYYSNGQIDGDLHLTGVRSEARPVGRPRPRQAPAGRQRRPAAGQASSRPSRSPRSRWPTVDREGSLDDKFDALS